MWSQPAMVLQQKLLIKIGKYSVSRRGDLNWSWNYLLNVTITYQAKHVTDVKFGSRWNKTSDRPMSAKNIFTNKISLLKAFNK